MSIVEMRSFQTSMSREEIQPFERDGYLVLRGIFEPDRDLQPLRKGFVQLIDALSHIYMAESPQAVPIDAYEDRPLGERFAILLGVSGGEAMHHLDPTLNCFLPEFRWRPDLPSAQISALFDLLLHPDLLGVLELLLGPEISSSPVYHVNFKLSSQHLEIVERLAAARGRAAPSRERFFPFQVGTTGWHMDAVSGLRDSHESRIVVVWIPMTETDEEVGRLRIVPGSHRRGFRSGPFAEEETRRAIEIPASPGDVVLFDNKTLHSATPNTSATGYRWAFNFRYLPAGQPTGRPFLPSFLVRSRRSPERALRNPFLWGTAWERALARVSALGPPFSYAALREGAIDLDAARALTRQWNRLAPDVHGWIRLGSTASLRSAVAKRAWSGLSAR